MGDAGRAGCSQQGPPLHPKGGGLVWQCDEEMCGREKKNAFSEDQASTVDRLHLSNLMFHRQNPELQQQSPNC